MKNKVKNDLQKKEKKEILKEKKPVMYYVPSLNKEMTREELDTLDKKSV